MLSRAIYYHMPCKCTLEIFLSSSASSSSDVVRTGLRLRSSDKSHAQGTLPLPLIAHAFTREFKTLLSFNYSRTSANTSKNNKIKALHVRERMKNLIRYPRFSINPANAVQHGGSIEKISRYNVIQVIILLSCRTSVCSLQFSPC